jgi:glycosyltransferase involved in cell wall biosynthesis
LTVPPLLSIGVPTYNGERYLAEALESALRQDYPNIEVLVSDTASTDSTPEICRRFESDSRVRYERSPETTSPSANFHRVLEMAQGTYFTWLAHDDLLSNPAYASTLVEALEANPDAVLCASSVEVFRDDPAERFVVSYPERERPWRVARRGLFRWPQENWETFLYGIFRRDPLQRVFVPHWTFPDFLQRLGFAGRFIFEPAALRRIRLHEGSLGRTQLAKSDFELLLRGVRFKWMLLRLAATSPAPPGERLRLTAIALRNFLTNHLAWAHSVRSQIRDQEAELAILSTAAREREALIRRSGGEPPAHLPIELAGRPPQRLGWFRRPNVQDAAYLRELIRRVAEARRVCDELLAVLQTSPPRPG